MTFREATTHSPPPAPKWLEVLETRAEIPYWPRVCTQIWVVILIGWCKFLTRQDQLEMGSETLFA